jgi:hypothetical protein
MERCSSVSAKSIVFVAGLALLISGCAPGTETYVEEQAGFFSGIWHGWIAPIAIIWHFVFDDSVRVYETNNTGIWYDVGFYMAIISGFGSLGLTRRERDRSSRSSSD